MWWQALYGYLQGVQQKFSFSVTLSSRMYNQLHQRRRSLLIDNNPAFVNTTWRQTEPCSLQYIMHIKYPVVYSKI